MNDTTAYINVTWACTFLQNHVTFLNDYKPYENLILPVLLTLNCFSCFLIIPSNLLVVCTILKTANLRRTISNLFILGLAISDLGIGIVLQPAYITVQVYELIDHFEHYCIAYRVLHHVAWIFACASQLTLAALIIDRFMIVHFHLRHQQLVTTRRVVIVLLLIWAYSFAASILAFFNPNFLIVNSILFLLTNLIEMFFIIKIFRCVRRHSLMIQAQQQSIPGKMSAAQMRKSVNPMYYMFGAFILCFFPFYVTTFMQGLMGNSTDVMISLKVTDITGLVNSLLNPLIYYWRITELRAASYNLLRKTRL